MVQKIVINNIQASSIITRSNVGDFCVNPYVGCAHSCGYCYAKFMQKFTTHMQSWGSFVDVKRDAADLVPSRTDKYKGKRIIIGTVTDAYQPLERNYKLTRAILKKLIPLQPRITIITKSKLVTRDIDLLKQFSHCSVSVSLSIADDDIRKKIEPYASSVKERIHALEMLSKSGIWTSQAIAPLLPYITDWQALIEKTYPVVRSYWFESLNMYEYIQERMVKCLSSIDPSLIPKYQQIYTHKNNYWRNEAEKIKIYCRKHNIRHRIYIHPPRNI